jgi:hypothetical protein
LQKVNFVIEKRQPCGTLGDCNTYLGLKALQTVVASNTFPMVRPDHEDFFGGIHAAASCEMFTPLDQDSDQVPPLVC